MSPIDRRSFLLGSAGLLVAGSALAQGHAAHGGMYESLKEPGRIGLPENAATQQVFDSPAPKAATQGRWIARAPLPSPRSEMAWATAYQNRMHLLGGYGDQRVDRPYHHVYDASADAWTTATPLPRGANHVGVEVLDGTLYAIGGFIEQNRRPHGDCFALSLTGGPWRKLAPRHGLGAVAIGDFIYVAGGGPIMGGGVQSAVHEAFTLG